MMPCANSIWTTQQIVSYILILSAHFWSWLSISGSKRSSSLDGWGSFISSSSSSESSPRASDEPEAAGRLLPAPPPDLRRLPDPELTEAEDRSPPSCSARWTRSSSSAKNQQFWSPTNTVFTGFPQGKSQLGRDKLTSASSACCCGDNFALLCFAVF